jgi:hypothetical protein
MIGFDKHPLNQGLLLDMTLTEYWVLGAVIRTYDLSKAHHVLHHVGGSINSLPSGCPYIQLGGGAVFMECHAADSVDLNFTATPFTLAAWINADPAGADMVMCQGVNSVDGWELEISGAAALAIEMRCNQAGSYTRVRSEGVFTPNVWTLIGVTRAAGVGAIYVNGVATALVAGAALVNPVSVAGGHKFLIGVNDDEGTQLLNGSVGGGPLSPKIWNRALTPAEMAELFALTRHWAGV